jgi:hypothetical protein
LSLQLIFCNLSSSLHLIFLCLSLLFSCFRLLYLFIYPFLSSNFSFSLILQPLFLVLAVAAICLAANRTGSSYDEFPYFSASRRNYRRQSYMSHVQDYTSRLNLSPELCFLPL